jgi:uncharacterized protein (DUF1330 family)
VLFVATVDVLARFLKASGYSESDVLAHNPKTLTFVTSNGGKYVIRGGKLRTLMGPPYPKERPAEVAEE